MFRTNFSRILDRLDSVESRLERIEHALEDLRGAEALRGELNGKQQQMDALAQQALHLVDLLAEARAQIARLEKGSSA